MNDVSEERSSRWLSSSRRSCFRSSTSRSTLWSEPGSFSSASRRSRSERRRADLLSEAFTAVDADTATTSKRSREAFSALVVAGSSAKG